MARYELVERIGVGGMAEIFRGKAIASGGFEKPVAIKRILPHLSQDKRFVTLLITEAKTLSQLRHRNIVQIYDVGLGDDGQYFLVMEYVEGADLGRLYESLETRSRRLPLDVALYIAGEICEALEHAHLVKGSDGAPLGLVHRDVSPSNVLLSRSGEVKLTDFGIAKRMEESTGHGGVRGKFAYISPEQAHNTHVDARSDVYSVGIVLYELVTGHRLFSDLPDFDALRAVREGRLPRPRDIDPSIDRELDRILVTALAPRPEDRFTSAGTLGAQLRTCRYSLLSTVADPAVEISRLVEELTDREEHRPLGREPSIVRISTVAGFSGSFDVPEEPAGASLTGETTRVPTGPFGTFDPMEEEQTRAVRMSSSGRRAAPTDPLDDVETRIGGMRRGASELDLRGAETSILEYSPPPGLSPGPPPVDGIQSAGDGRAREPTPTVRQLFHAGGLLDDGSEREDVRAAPATPILDGRLSPGRRRAILIASGAAVLLAVLAFVVAGTFLGDDSRAQTHPPVDAAPPPVDATVPAAAVPTATVEPPAERPKRKRKRPPKKKPGKGGERSDKGGDKKRGDRR